MARGSLQIAARMAQVASSPSSVFGHSTVRRSSARTMSSRVSNGRGAALGGDVGHAAERAALVGRRVGVADDVGAPVRRGRGRRRPPCCGPARRAWRGRRGRPAAAMRSSSGRPMTSPQPGNEEEGAVGAEAHVHRDERRHGQGDDPPAGGGGGGRRRELVLDALGRAGVDGEDVPVERPLGGDAHGGHQVDLFGAEGVEAAVGDVLERRPLVAPPPPRRRRASRAGRRGAS